MEIKYSNGSYSVVEISSTVGTRYIVVQQYCLGDTKMFRDYDEAVAYADEMAGISR